MCIGHLLYPRLFKCFHWVDHRNPVLLSYSCDSPSHRCRNWGTERLNILPLVTEGAKDRQDWNQSLFSGSYWSLSRLSLSAGRPKISVPPLLCLLTPQFSVFLPRSGLAIPQNLLVVFFLHVCMCACMRVHAHAGMSMHIYVWAADLSLSLDILWTRQGDVCVSVMLYNSLEPVNSFICSSSSCFCVISSVFCPSSAVNLLCNFRTCIALICALFTITNQNGSHVLLAWHSLICLEGWRKWNIVSAGIQWFLCKIKHCEKSCSPHPSIPLSFIGQVGQVPLLLWQENLSSWVRGDPALLRQSVPENWGLHININPPSKHKVPRYPPSYRSLLCASGRIEDRFRIHFFRTVPIDIDSFNKNDTKPPPLFFLVLVRCICNSSTWRQR